MPDRRPGLSPGAYLRTREEDKLASPSWKLLEDLGAKKMEAQKGGRGRKAVSLYPPPAVDLLATDLFLL